MAPVHQLTEDDIIRSSTLDARDIGKWVWASNGCIQGFTDTHDEVVDMFTNNLPPHVICLQEAV